MPDSGKAVIQKDTYTPMFLATLFTISRTGKQSTCSSAKEWIKKLRYMYTMEYYSVIKGNAFESVLMRWMNTEPIIQSSIPLCTCTSTSLSIHLSMDISVASMS